MPSGSSELTLLVLNLNRQKPRAPRTPHGGPPASAHQLCRNPRGALRRPPLPPQPLMDLGEVEAYGPSDLHGRDAAPGDHPADVALADTEERGELGGVNERRKGLLVVGCHGAPPLSDGQYGEPRGTVEAGEPVTYPMPFVQGVHSRPGRPVLFGASSFPCRCVQPVSDARHYGDRA